MDYSTLLDLSAELGYRLAMAGAETFRVEESISRFLAAYGIESEVFVITNCLHVSIDDENGTPVTRMRRIGPHGNDLEAVERYSNLSRRICAEKPTPAQIQILLDETQKSCKHYSMLWYFVGHFVSSAGFAIFFGGTLLDAFWSGICGVLIGLVSLILSKKKVNAFFTTIASSFITALAAYAVGALGIADNTDTIVIGALMLLVPGLLFTNAMRDIIFGDTNSGTNRIVQVLLIAAAIILGTGGAWNFANFLWTIPANSAPLAHSYIVTCIATAMGCAGFIIVFNIHGKGFIFCTLGGIIAWGAYCLTLHFGGSNILAYFVGGVVAAAYSETMARIRKYPAISYLVISIFPLIPGAGIYYSASYLTQKEMSLFTDKAGQTIAIAGVIAVGILLVSTVVRLWTVWRQSKSQKKELR